MDYTTLGKNGPKVSRICLGTMMFGDATNEADSLRIIDRAIDVGINFIDTNTDNVFDNFLDVCNLESPLKTPIFKKIGQLGEISINKNNNLQR